ncbi:MAG: universal stress protein [Candidatus Neomarinimicrobiota bacterium]|jgi:nucleotide-binding universal stress UspA family protein|tara:strand:+ start:336 stop:1217 length:882 start_codon:yes stop_codon:yes gene_type:complete
MKILIAIGGREFSKPTLDLGMKIANSFKCSTTIAYVGKKISQFSEKDVSVVHQNLDDRELYRPGIRTLEWAYDFLISKKYIEEKDSNKFDDYLLVDEENSRMKVLLKGQQSDKIDLIMRTGEIIEQLKDEVETNKHDITIIGGGGNKGIHQKLVQFIDSSVFVVKNYSVNKKYKILLPVNDSMGSDMAIETAINFAKSYKLNVEIVSVPEGKKSIEEVEKILKKTKEKFSKNRIKTTTKLIDGSAVDSIVNYAKDDSIVILGVSPKNPIMKYFFGSKPLSIAQKCNCPVLITK